MYSAVYSLTLFGSVPHTCTLWHAWAKRRLEPITWITQEFLLLVGEGMQGKYCWMPTSKVYCQVGIPESRRMCLKSCTKEMLYAHLSHSNEWVSRIPHCISQIQGVCQGHTGSSTHLQISPGTHLALLQQSKGYISAMHVGQAADSESHMTLCNVTLCWSLDLLLQQTNYIRVQ